jgi:predicted DNA-binding protein with PD1-like motif
MRELGPKTPRWSRAWKRLLWRYEAQLKEEESMIRAAEFQLGRTFVGRLPEQYDILESLTEFCREKDVKAAWISAIGTVQRAVLGFFDQEEGVYRRIPLEEELEIVSCQGNVSLKEGEPFVHLHILLSDVEGKTLAGHLFEGTTFVGEFWMQEFIGPNLDRQPDEWSGLSLWALED